MSKIDNDEKRYRFQIQFDLFADSDKEAVQEVLDMIEEMKQAQNPNIIWMAENYYASFQNRVDISLPCQRADDH